MEQNKIYYTYQLIDPRNNAPFYVGKGTGRRMLLHFIRVKNGRNLINKHLQNKLQQLLNENLEPIYKKILESNNEVKCLNKERELIEKIGIDRLCNLTYGGEGETMSKEIKSIQSKKAKERWKNKNLRKEQSLKIKKLINDGKLLRPKGKNNPMYGKCAYDIWIEKYGKEKADEMKQKTIKKISISTKGRKQSNIEKEHHRKGALNRKKLTCPHCNRNMDISNAKQWHFDNCKYKGNSNEKITTL